VLLGPDVIWESGEGIEVWGSHPMRPERVPRRSVCLGGRGAEGEPGCERPPPAARRSNPGHRSGRTSRPPDSTPGPRHICQSFTQHIPAHPSMHASIHPLTFDKQVKGWMYVQYVSYVHTQNYLLRAHMRDHERSFRSR